MFTLEFFEKVIEQQGIVAGLLLIMICQQWGMQNKLLAKICKLQDFIMTCLKDELDEDRKQDRVKT